MQPSKDSQELFQESLSKVKAYLQNLPLPPGIKETLCSNIDKHSSYYLFYPHLFKDAFKIDKSEKLEMLCIAGYLFYRSLVYIDKIVDSQVKKEDIPNYFQLSLICQEESIKILTTLFPLKSNFWILWNKRKSEYLQAQKLEKTGAYPSDDNFFHTIADFKSAFGKIAIDSLAILNQHEENSEAYKSMLLAHKHFSIARQMYDDVIDIKEDVTNKQINYAAYKLKNACEKEGIDFSNLDELYLEKYLYVLGVSEVILNESIVNFETAIEISLPFIGMSSLWVETNKAYIHLTNYSLIKQSSYLKQIKAQAEHSNKTKSNAKLDKAEIQERIYLGLKFLEKNLSISGYWEEYLNSAGASNTWATSFITSFIYDINDSNNFISIDKVREYLVSKLDRGFRYNDIAPMDGDSTNFGLLALHFMGIDLTNSIGMLLKYQNSDGGFTTYCSDNRESLKALMDFQNTENFNSWEASHNCVSAVSLYLLSVLRKTVDVENCYHRLKSYLINRQSTALWGSYWWTSSLYATGFIIKATSESRDNELIHACSEAIHSIHKLQNRNGSFGDSFQKESAFYTGLITNSLISSSSILATNRNLIINSIEWIIKNQFDDGSWPETNAMRLPSFRNNNPDEIKSWPARRMGLNVRAIEFNRLFSTATCLSALNSYACSKF